MADYIEMKKGLLNWKIGLINYQGCSPEIQEAGNRKKDSERIEQGGLTNKQLVSTRDQ